MKTITCGMCHKPHTYDAKMGGRKVTCPTFPHYHFVLPISSSDGLDVFSPPALPSGQEETAEAAVAPAGPAVAVRESWVRRTAKRLLVLAATEKGPEVLFWLGCKLLVGSGVIGIVSFLLTRLGIASWFGLN